MSNDWVVMFVDMQGSTAMKYQQNEDVIHTVITRLYDVICTATKQRQRIKFTGDGAMIAYSALERRDTSIRALRDAAAIVQNIDRLNYRFDCPVIHIRVGIASGDCRSFRNGADDLIGIRVDLAARLCQEAAEDTLLVDENTLQWAGLVNDGNPIISAGDIIDAAAIQVCDRRLSLKGVPLVHNENFWEVSIRLFASAPSANSFESGLVALYLNRERLTKDLNPTKLIQLAKRGGRFLVAGRTLISWAQIGVDLLVKVAEEKNLKIDFMIVSEHALRHLDLAQEKAAKDDLARVVPFFMKLLERDKNGWFRLHQSDSLILDGITCADIWFEIGTHSGEYPTKSLSFSRLIALQDVNAASATPSSATQIANAKAAILWACNCQESQPSRPCMAHGLHRRTQALFEKARSITRRALEVEHFLQGHPEGLAARNNRPKNYLPRMLPYFDCIRQNRLNDVPAPLCVQIQISSQCSTRCRMCSQWQDNSSNDELTAAQWIPIFNELGSIGVKTVIFSGGEPLARKDIAKLLRSAHSARLRIGLLTSGMLSSNIYDTGDVLDAISTTVDWVAISVDGNEAFDHKVRNPDDSSSRTESLQHFCRGIFQRNRDVRLSATVTLQADNILMDVDKACTFIRDEIGIPQVNFKFATGATDALATARNFRISEKGINEFLKGIAESSSRTESWNNLDYLRRTIDARIFDVSDIVNGAPLAKFYGRSDLRCFTPFFFSLIGCDGSVYPCCHLYRDNHSADPKTKEYRKEYSMGNLKAPGVNFKEAWNGEKYAKERKRLAKIDPVSSPPCGECTRYCQHNIMLTGAERLYAGQPDEMEAVFKKLSANQDEDAPVWF